MLCTSGSGALFDKCFDFSFFKNLISLIICDKQCRAEQIAKKHNIPCIVIQEKDDYQFNEILLDITVRYRIDYIFSYSFLRLFRTNFLTNFPFEVFNSHFSLLPAFKGYYNQRDKSQDYPARSIFERTMAHGSLITGNTIHLVNEHIDDGVPIMISLLPIDRSNMTEKEIRHQLFIQECKSILQFCKWLGEDRILKENNTFAVKNAKYVLNEFIPKIDDLDINALTF